MKLSIYNYFSKILPREFNQFSGFSQSYKRPCLFRSIPSIWVELAHQIISTYSFLGLCGHCCLICQAADSNKKLGESYLLCLVLGCFVPCLPVCLARNKAREKYNLEGSTGKNQHISYFCTMYGKYRYFNFHESQQ